MKIILALIVILNILEATCTDIVDAIAWYKEEKKKISLGDSKTKVLQILLPTQEGLCEECVKKPTKFVKNGKSIEVHYFRSRWIPDDKTTNNEFTPYFFKDDKLVAVGWKNVKNK